VANVTRLSFEQGNNAERRRLHLREISPDIDVPLENVGQDLRTARQRKGEDLASVSRMLKIRKDHLEALEESRFDALPGRPYALGFVRSYAEYLGLDSNEFVERYKTEIAGLFEPLERQVALNTEPERRMPQGTIVFAVLLLIGVAYGGYYLSSAAGRAPAEQDAAIPARVAAAVAAENAPAPAPVPEIAEEPVEQQTAESETAAVAPTEAQIAALPAGRAYGTQNTGSRITLRMHSPTHVLVRAPDNTIFINRDLSPGDLYQAPDVVGMTISTPNSGAVELILDGVSVGYLGESGSEAETLSLNPQDIVDRAERPAG
jgi:cytoskeleton protein RodZ